MNEPRKNPGESATNSEDSLLVVIEGPGDTTRRPRRPNIPRDEPRREPQRPTDGPPTNGPS